VPVGEVNEPAKKGRFSARWALMTAGGTLALCGVLYACSVPPRRELDAYTEHLRAQGQPAYPLEATDPDDAQRTLEALRRSTGYWTLNYRSRRSGGEYSRACLFVRVNLPEGGRFMDVALEEAGGGWKVRDLSFERDCASEKRGDMRLH